MTLRARLTLGLIVLATAGLVTADVVNYTSLRSFLLTRVDDSLDQAFHSLTTALPVGKTQGVNPGTITTYEGGIIPGDCVQLRQLSGTVIGHPRCLPQYQQTSFPPIPRWPDKLTLPANLGTRYFTLPAVSGGGHYRVRVSIEKGQPNYALLIATPLTGIDGTLHRLLVIEIIVTALVLAALGVVGLWIVRLGLRPLAAIADTASAIAGGDLSQRIEHVDERTEIGELARSLNTMLGQIEGAFQAREESELKLRRFVADASHELRTPVQAVRAYAELFSRGAADRPEDLERAMLGVKLASERMSALVDDLFLLAHLDEGRPLAGEPVDLERVVAEAVEVARALEPDRPIAVESEPLLVVGDPSRLRQLVDNLLANVRVHTPPTTPVRVTLERRNGDAALQVSDSGSGIDADSLPHVFERFYRADPARGGSGLGLAIVSALADAHGGTATVESEPGAGTTFTITLPLAPEASLRNAGNRESFPSLTR